MLTTLAQAAAFDHDLRAMAAVMTAGTVLALVVVALRGLLTPTVYAVVTVASATLGLMYVAAAISSLSSILKVAMPSAGVFLGGPERGSRAVVAILALSAGLALSWFTLMRDEAADPPEFADMPGDAEPDDVDVEGPGAELVDPRSLPHPPDDEDELLVMPLLPEAAGLQMRAQLPQVTFAMGVAALTAVFGSLVGDPILSNGFTSVAKAGPALVAAGFLTALAVLLPAWLHDDVHVATAVSAVLLVAGAFLFEGWVEPNLRVSKVAAALVGFGAGTVVPTSLYLLGELRAQVSRRAVFVGSALALATVVGVHMGMTAGFEKDDNLKYFERLNEDR